MGCSLPYNLNLIIDGKFSWFSAAWDSNLNDQIKLAPTNAQWSGVVEGLRLEGIWSPNIASELLVGM